MQDNNKMYTMTECVNELQKEGYDAQFKVDHHALTVPQSDERFNPDDVRIIKHFRFEGQSDPGDMTVVYALETKSGVKGTLIDGFGTYGDEDVGQFIRQVQEVNGRDNGQ